MAEIIGRIMAVKQRYDLRDYVLLDKSEAKYQFRQVWDHIKIVCPFHTDKAPSLAVYHDHFYCFGCGETGDILDWVAKRYATSIGAALEMLEGSTECVDKEVLHRKLPTKRKVQTSVGEERLQKTLYNIIDLGEKHFLGSPAEQYCRERQWEHEKLWPHHLGFIGIGHGAQRLSDALSDTEAVDELGLRDRNGRPWFTERLLIPLFDLFGKPIAISTRKLHDSDDIRYVNSRRTLLFNRSKMLYGAHLIEGDLLEGSAPDAPFIWVVEGYSDVWSLTHIDVPSVAAMTCRLSDTQLEWLALMGQSSGKRIVLAFDGDKPGRAGQWDAYLRLCHLSYTSVSRIRLADGDDVSSVVEREGRKAFAGDLAYLKELSS